MRRYVRHPSSVPVELTRCKGTAPSRQRLSDISLGGLACTSARAFRPGTPVDLHMPNLGEQSRCSGVVAWCRREPHGYLVGVAFTDHDALFRARMVEQICQIEDYRRRREHELGVRQEAEVAAREWIERHAAEFAAQLPCAAPPRGDA
jgi:hypothetical protein